MANLEARARIVEEHVRHENEHDIPAVMETFGSAARYDDEPWDEHHEGKEQVRAYYDTIYAAAPDLHIDIRQRHVTEAAIILEVVISGTHLGSWRGLPGTGRPLNFPLCGIYTFDENDLLAGEKIYYDRATVLRQIGVFHEPVSLAGRLTLPLMHPATVSRAFGRMIFRRL
jgi:steroid delta-isomerase-like uncharacterized protein